MIPQYEESVRRGFRLRQAFLVLAAAALLAPAGAGAPPPKSEAQEEVTRSFQKTVTLGAGQSVSVDHSFGGMRIHASSGRDVNINATIRVQTGSRSDSESFADKIKIEVEPASDGGRVRTVYPDPEKRWFSFGKHTPYSVNYDTPMPPDAPLPLKN